MTLARTVLAGLGCLGLAQAAAAQTEITWMTHPIIFAATANGDFFKKFEQENGIKVTVTTFPTDALGQRLTAEFVAGSPAFDVLSIADAFWSERLTRFVEPLRPHIAAFPLERGLEDFSPGMVQQFSVPQTAAGEIFAIPQRMSTDLLFYRKDLLEQAGVAVPKTMDEYVATARKLTGSGGRPDLFGACIQGAQSMQGTQDWYVQAAAMGSDLMRPPEWKLPAFNNPAAVHALELRQQMVRERSVSPGALSYSFDDCINAVAQGKAAMATMFSAYWSQLNDPNKSEVVGKIGYATVPSDPGLANAYIVRGWGLGINKASQHKQDAWKFIAFITSPDVQKKMAIQFGNPVVRLSVTEDPDFIAAVPIAGALSLALQRTKIMPNTPYISRIWDILSANVNAATAGRVPAAEALAKAEAEVGTVVGK